jgi:hypothetical protein
MKRLFLYVFALLILLAIVISAGRGNDVTTLLPQYAERIAATAEAEEWAAVEWARKQSGKWSAKTEVPAKIAAQSNTVFFRIADSLVFWSNNKALLHPADLKNFRDKNGRSLLHLPSGWFMYFQESVAEGTLAVLTPLRYLLENEATGPFPADAAIPTQVQITDAPTDFPLAIGGKPLAYLKTDATLQSPLLQWLQLGAAALLLILLLLSVWRGAMITSTNCRSTIALAVAPSNGRLKAMMPPKAEVESVLKAFS